MEALRYARSGAGSLAVLALLAAGCTSNADHVLDVDAEGTAFVFLYRDDNLNSVFNSTVDMPVIGARVDLRLSGAISIRDGGATDTAGIRTIRVPVGRYVVEVDPAVLGDSLIVQSGSAAFTVTAADSILVPVGLAFETVTITAARALPPGRAAWVRGIVMNSPAVYGDSTVHLVDDSAAIRTTHVRPGLPVLPGDSALFLGRRTTRDGQPVIELLVIPVISGVVTPPPPDSVSTAKAATADGGALDARFARVAGAVISDTATVNGTTRLTVSDGSGTLIVELSPNANFGNRNQYVPDVVLDVRGLLVPDPAAIGAWVLKPRFFQDVTIVP